MALERELDEAVDELGVRDPGGLEELRVDARGREAGDRVELVDEHLAFRLDEEVDACHPLALAGDERPHGELLHQLDRLLVEARRGSRGHPLALAGDERPHGELLHELDRLLVEARRDHEVHPALFVLRRVVVPVGSCRAVRDDLPGQRRERLLVAEHAALDLDTFDELLDQHLLVVLEGERDGRRQLLLVVGLRDPDRGAQARRLDEDRVPERVLRPLSLPQGDVVRDRHAAVAHDRLEDVLVHCERRAEHARADVGHARELEQALHRPVLAERPVQDREDDVDVTERRRHALRRDGQRLGDRGAVGRPSRKLPAAVAADLDGDRLVPLRVERVQHRPRRGERDLVLGRASAQQHGHADAATHGLGGGGGSPVGKLPTVIVTVEPGLAFVPPVGDWLSTMPPSPGSVTSCRTIRATKPALSSVDCADPSSWLVTSGTVAFCGPFETLRVTVERGLALPLGLWSTTMPFASSLSTSLRSTAKPSFRSAELASAYVRPITEGTLTLAGPLETLIRTVLPLVITLPAAGSWPVTVPTGRLDATSKAFGCRPALTSAVTASSRELPITLGTGTVAFPFDTVISTVPCLAIFSPGSGL